MRLCSVNGRSGIIAAQDGKAGVPATKVFVLFDDDVNDSDAGWFPVHSVLPTGIRSVTF